MPAVACRADGRPAMPAHRRRAAVVAMRRWGAVPLAARHQVVLPSFVARPQVVAPAHGDCAPRSSSVCPVAVKPAGRLNVR